MLDTPQPGRDTAWVSSAYQGHSKGATSTAACSTNSESFAKGATSDCFPALERDAGIFNNLRYLVFRHCLFRVASTQHVQARVSRRGVQIVVRHLFSVLTGLFSGEPNHHAAAPRMNPTRLVFVW